MNTTESHDSANPGMEQKWSLVLIHAKILLSQLNLHVVKTVTLPPNFKFCIFLLGITKSSRQIDMMVHDLIYEVVYRHMHLVLSCRIYTTFKV